MGKLFTWGEALSGRLGNGTTTPNVTSPAQIGTDTDWDVVSNGVTHSLAIKNGKLYAWGGAADGKLGNGTTTPNVTSPVQIGTESDWTHISAGYRHSLGIRGGKLYAWGAAIDGRLGNGTTTPNVTSPVQIGTESDWTAIAAAKGSGGNHSLGIRNSGRLYSWGARASGVLGDGNTSGSTTSPTQVGTSTGWTDIAACNANSAGINSGELYTWGANAAYQLGDGTTTQQTTPLKIGSNNDWTRIVFGGNFAFGIRDGKLFSWGANSNGRTGQGTTTGNTTTPTQIGTSTGWTTITAGTSTGGAITGGELYTWGTAYAGLLGNGTTTPDTSAPGKIGTSTDWTVISIGDTHSAGVQFVVIAPANTAVPTLSGTFQTGQSVSTSDGSWSNSPTSYTYQWKRATTSGGSYSNISGATSSSYTIASGDAGYYLKCTVTATNGAGSADATSAASSQVLDAPANTAAPTLSGTFQTGQTVSASDGTWTGTPAPTYSYQWKRATTSGGSYSNISGATSSSYTIVSGDAGYYLKCTVTGTNDAGSASATSSASGQVTELPSISTPNISGTTQVGQTLTASASATAGYPAPTLSYQWQRSTNGTTWHNINDATDSTLLLVSNEAGKQIRVQATATNTEGSDTKTSSATSAITELPAIGLPTISGTTAVGETLTASASATAGYPAPTLSYQWKAAATTGGMYSNISGATSSTYELTANEAGKYIKVQVTATNSEGSASDISAATDLVTLPPANTSQPQILTDDDVLQVGSVMTSSHGSWDGAPYPSFAYQWQVSDDGDNSWTNIASQTSSSITLTSAQGGKYVRLQVTATNSVGSEIAYSAASAYIAEDPVSVIAPTISGVAKVEESVSCDPGEWTGFPEPDFSFNWQVSDDGSTGWNTIGGANTYSFMIGEEYADKFLRCLVQGSNDAGEASAASAPIGPVQGLGGSTAAIIGALIATRSL